MEHHACDVITACSELIICGEAHDIYKREFLKVMHMVSELHKVLGLIDPPPPPSFMKFMTLVKEQELHKVCTYFVWLKFGYQQ